MVCFIIALGDFWKHLNPAMCLIMGHEVSYSCFDGFDSSFCDRCFDNILGHKMNDVLFFQVFSDLFVPLSVRIRVGFLFFLNMVSNAFTISPPVLVRKGTVPTYFDITSTAKQNI